MAERITFRHIFVDHSNVWGGARLASRIKHPGHSDADARISVRILDRLLGGGHQGVSTKIVSGGIPPGMEGVWDQYQNAGYDTQRLIRDIHWKERGVDHSLIGHMWRLVAQHQSDPLVLVLASGDGKRNEFNTSFLEVVDHVLTKPGFDSWKVEIASFDWEYDPALGIRGPTNQRLKKLVTSSERGVFTNLMDSYDKLVFREA